MGLLKRIPRPLLFACFLAAAYGLFLFPVIFSKDLLLSHDNLRYHLSNFAYFANSILHGFGIPSWYPAHGGTPVSATSISLFPLLPARFAGYLLYCATSLTPLAAYKLGLGLGMLIPVFGWWLFLSELTGSGLGAGIGCLMLLCGGTGVTVLHQEQVNSTLAWMPWCLWAMLRARTDRRFFPVLAALCGVSMTAHYPQIQLLSAAFVLAAMLATRLGAVRDFAGRNRDPKVLLLAAALFSAGASPILSVGRHMRDFTSPLRGGDSIGAGSLEDYKRLNALQESSAKPGYLANYFRPQVHVDDGCAFFVTFTGVALFLVAVICRPAASLPFLVVLALAAWASLGTRAYFAQLMYLCRFPFIGYFRQWYHFFPVVNLCFAALGAIGFGAAVSLLEDAVGAEKGKAPVWRAAAFLAAGALMFSEGRSFLGRYAAGNLEHAAASSRRLDRKEFLDVLKSGGFSEDGRISLLAYAESARLAAQCPGMAVGSPLAVTACYDASGVAPGRQDDALRDFCSRGLDRHAVIADLKGPAPGEAKSGGPRRIALEDGKPAPDPPSKDGGSAMAFAGEGYVLTPRGARLEAEVKEPSVVVFPFAYKLGLAALMDGRPAETFPVYFGAMTGLIVRAGKFEIVLTTPSSAFSWAMALQYTALLGCLGLCLAGPVSVLLTRMR